MTDKWKHIDPRLLPAIMEQESLGGIDTRKLPPGTQVEVQTKNTLYTFEFLEKGRCLLSGGKYFADMVETTFPGSSFGGNFLKIGWIGCQMRMELPDPVNGNTILTSPVQSATVIGPDWEYKMEWPA